MKAITEDYVSYEIAKLLKEKGFDVYGDGSFDSGIEVFAEYSPSGTLNKCIDSKPHKKAYPAPTHQMATKWLREVHDIFIKFESVTASGITEWHPSLNLITENKYIHANKLHWYPSYEEAVEAALKYCLENLI